jgi:hypothetical protein
MITATHAATQILAVCAQIGLVVWLDLWRQWEKAAR